MQQSSHVLIITRDNIIRNLLEQVFIVRDIQIVIAATIHGAKAIIDLWGLRPFGLVIVDIAALGACESDQQLVGYRALEAWTAANARLPFIFLGTFFQKHAVQRIRADAVRVLVKPLHADELIDAIDELYLAKRCLKTSLPCNPR